VSKEKDEPLPVRSGFDPEMAGKRAECDGGGPVPGTQYAVRLDFRGRLSGEYVDHGDPPWRWYRMVDLTYKPEGYEEDSVWCESESVYLIDEAGGEGKPPGPR